MAERDRMTENNDYKAGFNDGFSLGAELVLEMIRRMPDLIVKALAAAAEEADAISSN